MRKILFLSVLFINCFFVFSQKMDTYYSIDNNKYSVGDTILVGYNSGYNQYESIKEYYFNSTYDQGYRNVRNNLFSKSLKIINIYKDAKSIYDTSAVIVEAKLIGSIVTKYIIDINKAVSNGELILLVNQYWKENKIATLYTDTTAFLFEFKQSEAPKELIAEYLCKFKTTIYEKYKNDEFELDNQKQIALNEIDKKIMKLNDSTLYFIDAELSFDNYDFSSTSFPINGFADYLTFKSHSRCYEYSENDLVFVNKEKFKYLKIDKHIANGLVKRRKNKYGDIDRKVYVRIFFKNSSMINDDTVNLLFQNDKYKSYIFASIKHIDFYEFNNRVYNYLGRTKLK